MTNDYVIGVHDDLSAVPAEAWDRLLLQQHGATPFMRHAYLQALSLSGSAVPETGWELRVFTLHRQGELHAATVLYLKPHSYGEYVFDWAWAQAYEQYGLRYYPKAVVAVPFTPVPGARLLAVDASARIALVKHLIEWCGAQQLSSLHLLFGNADDVTACEDAGMLMRSTVQFHWEQRASEPPFADFEDFLRQLSQEKRKKIRQERRKVVDAGVRFRWARGRDISDADWQFFYRCYARTYREHGNPPYLSADFFARMSQTLPDAWLMFIAEREERAIACSLIGIDADQRVAYGRYWGAVERVDCLHFEACYYQPIEWCIAHGFQRFEGGAQGEHKMARALMPVRTCSAHWLAHPAFADAVQRFLDREGQGIDNYLAPGPSHPGILPHLPGSRSL